MPKFSLFVLICLCQHASWSAAFTDTSEDNGQGVDFQGLLKSYLLHAQQRRFLSRADDRGQRHQSLRNDFGQYNQFNPLNGGFTTRDSETSTPHRPAWLERGNKTIFERAAYQFFLQLLCPRQWKDADKARFNTQKFVEDLDSNLNFILEDNEGPITLSDSDQMTQSEWLSQATSRYRQSHTAAFTMFDLFDLDRSATLGRTDFTHLIIDTNSDGRVSVCEAMDHVTKVARLAERYGDFTLRNQGRVLWNSLYDPSFAPPPAVSPEVSPTASSLSDVTPQSEPTPEPEEPSDSNDNNTSNSSDYDPTSEPEANYNSATDDDIQNQTKPLTYNTNVIPRQGKVQPEQEVTSPFPVEKQKVKEKTTEAPLPSDQGQKVTTDDLVVRGFFKFQG